MSKSEDKITTQPPRKRSTKQINYKAFATEGTTNNSDNQEPNSSLIEKVSQIKSSCRSEIGVCRSEFKRSSVDLTNRFTAILAQEERKDGDPLSDKDAQQKIQSQPNKLGLSLTESNRVELQQLFEKEMNELYTAFQQALDSLEQTLLNKLNIIQSNFTELFKKISDLEDQQDAMEQYSRRDCLVFHRIQEKPNENTDQTIIQITKEFLNINLSIKDIARSHRLGQLRKSVSPDNHRPRPIIVKFESYRTRSEVFFSKSKLSKKPIVITESLTPKRLFLLSQVRKEIPLKNSWTRDGSIIILLQNSTKAFITNDASLDTALRKWKELSTTK